MKRITYSLAKKKAWTAFSLWIRLSGNPIRKQCYTCEKYFDPRRMNAGHGIGGRNNAILFEERIVKPQCAGCNIWGRGQYQIFTRKLIDELGLDVYDQIVSQSRIPVKFKVADLLEIEKKYQDKLKGIQGEGI